MRRFVFTRLTLMCALLPFIGGCEVLRLNEGREFAVYSAGYAGRYRIAHGRWPDVRELEEFTCMHGRADDFGLALRSCEEVVLAPYHTRLTPNGGHLRMEFIDAAQKTVCTLEVLSPPARADKAVFPMVVIKTSVFSCPGDGQASSVKIG
jgi:hypothetical protein